MDPGRWGYGALWSRRSGQLEFNGGLPGKIGLSAIVRLGPIMIPFKINNAYVFRDYNSNTLAIRVRVANRGFSPDLFQKRL